MIDVPQGSGVGPNPSTGDVCPICKGALAGSARRTPIARGVFKASALAARPACHAASAIRAAALMIRPTPSQVSSKHALDLPRPRKSDATVLVSWNGCAD